MSGSTVLAAARGRRVWALLGVAILGISAMFQYGAFTAGPGAAYAASVNEDLDQWANGSPPPVGASWQNGNLNQNNSAYHEGDAVPFRLALEGLTAGQHTIHLEYDVTEGGHLAYDFLTTYDVTESPDLCGVGGGGVSTLCPNLGSPSTTAFPSDPFSIGGLTISGAESFAGVSRTLVLYGGTIDSVAATVHAGTTGGTSTGDVLVTFTIPNVTTGAALFAWAAHIAQSDYWAGNGALNISGAPWHMRVQQLDGGGQSNQDRSIQPSALIQPPAPTASPTPTATSTPTATPTATPTTTASPTLPPTQESPTPTVTGLPAEGTPLPTLPNTAAAGGPGTGGSSLPLTLLLLGGLAGAIALAASRIRRPGREERLS